MDASLRSLYHIICLGFVISLPGVLVDLDHLYGRLFGWGPRAFHYLAQDNLIVLVLYGMVFGLIDLAFIYRWVLEDLK